MLFRSPIRGGMCESCGTRARMRPGSSLRLWRSLSACEGTGRAPAGCATGRDTRMQLRLRCELAGWPPLRSTAHLGWDSQGPKFFSDCFRRPAARHSSGTVDLMQKDWPGTKQQSSSSRQLMRLASLVSLTRHSAFNIKDHACSRIIPAEEGLRRVGIKLQVFRSSML